MNNNNNNKFNKTGRYNGNIVDCIRQGEGKYIYPGDIYEYYGPWVESEKHGINAKFSLIGYFDYEGDFQNGEITGKGSKNWIDGRSYIGDWQDGEMHGKGIWKSSNGKEIYEGEFINNKREGQGNLQLSNGDRYNGSFLQHKYHGNGQYLRENIFFIQSDFKLGFMSGNCQIQWHKIAIYNGQCENNKLHGHGYFKCLDNTFETDTLFINNHPRYHVTGFELKIDRSSCIEEIIDPKEKAKKDKKDKEKKKPTGKKGNAVIEIEVMATIPAGEPLGSLLITLQYDGLDSSNNNNNNNNNLPNPQENKRLLSIKLREFTPQATPELQDQGLGNIVSFWKRDPTLEEYSTSWNRFPPCSYRFINGINPLNDERWIIENFAEFSGVYENSDGLISTKLSTSSLNRILVPFPSNIIPISSSLTIILDFKLNSIIDFFSNESSFLRYNIQSKEYLCLTIFSLNHGSNEFELNLLVPQNSNEGNLWINCLWELRLVINNNNNNNNDNNDNKQSIILSRWSDSENFDINLWHSIGFTLSNINNSNENNNNTNSIISTTLVVDGSGRVKINKGEEETRQELYEFLTQASTDEKILNIGGDNKPFDGFVKNIIICNESDRCDIQDVTSCYSQWNNNNNNNNNNQNNTSTNIDNPPITQNSLDENENVPIPPNCKVLQSLDILSCGGKAVLEPSIIIPSNILPGNYVLEIVDSVNEKCLQKSTNSLQQNLETTKGSLELSELCQVIPPAKSSRSQFKIAITEGR